MDRSDCNRKIVLFPQTLTLAYGSLAYGTFPVPDWYITPVYKLMDVAGYGLGTGGVPLLIGILMFIFLLPFMVHCTYWISGKCTKHACPVAKLWLKLM